MTKDISDLRMECAKLGLEVVQINSEEQMFSIKRYLIDLGVSLNTQFAIPLFYDYSCQMAKCNQQYRSINDANSLIVKTIVGKNINPNFHF